MAASWAWSATAATFEDIQLWTGNGTNRAGLVIDWNDGKDPHSLAWGYRWNGTATGLDMLKGIVAADSRLFAHLGQLGWGTGIFGIGYDQNHSGGFNTTPALSFDGGGLAVEAGAENASDARAAADSADHFAEGWNTGFWAYYLKNSTTEGWSSATTGADGRTLTNGTWDGFSFAANFISVEPSEPTPAAANPFAFEVVAAQTPFGASPYDDPASLLGMPSTNFYDPWGGWSGGTTERRVKLVEPAYNLDATQTRKLITTLNEGSSIVVRFEQPITDDPVHPYGIDLLVFGNAFYTASGFVNDGSDMNTLMLAGGGFYEPMKVSVSPGYTGAPGQNPTNLATWDWYRYDNGPYADTDFPTHAYHWNRTNSTWSSELMDFTKPVNPVFGPVLEAGGLSAADAIEFYDGSGGGTGFDLAESGFARIQYVRIEGLEGFSGGEIDALSAVRPAVLGDSLTVAPGNLANGTSTLRFQFPAQLGQAAVALSFTSVSEAVRVSTMPLAVASVLSTNYGRVLTASQLGLTPVLGSNDVSFNTDLRVWAGPNYQGNGADLVLLRKVDGDWEDVTSIFDTATRSVAVSGVTNLFTLALIQAQAPRMSITRETDGFGDPVMAVHFAALPGFTYTLERSGTLDFSQAKDVASISPLVAQLAKLFDSGLPGKTFYRVRVSRR
jgi:hypothetical protein